MSDRSLGGRFNIHRWTKVAVSTAAFVIGSVLSLSFFLPELDFRLSLLLIGLIFIGMPHGAMDIFLLFKSFGQGKKLFVALAAYVLVAAPIVLLWPIFPTACFVFFVTYSLFHFADSDIQTTGPGRLMEMATRLPLPFCLPYIFHQSETLKLVHWIQPNIDLTPFDFLISAAGTLSLALVAIHTGTGLVRFISRFPNEDMSFLEPMVLAVLFVFISPLYSLAIYFCFIHSIKHLVNIATRIEITSLKYILPFWLIPLIGLPLISYLKLQNIAQLESGLFQYSLVVLSALALPHSILVRYGKSTGLLA